MPGTAEKPSKQYRTSPYTVRQYCALPYAQRIAVDAACEAKANVTYSTCNDGTSAKPFTVGRLNSEPAPEAAQETSPPPSPTSSPSPQLNMLFTETGTAAASAPETATGVVFAVHRPTSGPNAPEAQPYLADLLTVASEFVSLKEESDGSEWTHWGASPLTKSEGHRFAINANKNIFKCFGSGRSGSTISFVMALKKMGEPEALAWLAANFPAPTEPLALAEPEPEQDLRPSPEEEYAARVGDSEVSDFTAAPAPEADEPAPTRAEVEEPTLVQDGSTYQTTNYDLFHLLPENRPVDAGHVRKLVAMITRTNLLHVKPLDVTATMGVIDGQHRLAAARELGLPVYYKVTEELSEADITTLNVAQKNWTGSDWLHYWTVKGNPDYMAMSSFMALHPKLSFSNAKLMLSVTAKAGTEEFRAGRWKAGQAHKAEQVAVLVERIIAEVPSYKNPTHSGFVAALYHCVVSVEGFDPKEFMRTVLLQPLALVPCASHKQFMEAFDSVYNYRKPGTHRVNFQ